MTNQCDVEELKHQLLQKFYKLTEKPEEWNRGHYLFDGDEVYLKPPFRIDTTGPWYVLTVNGLVIHTENSLTIEKQVSSITRRFWYGTRYIEALSDVNVPSTSEFISNINEFKKDFKNYEECKILEEALANVNKPKESAKESKPKRPRKEKNN